MQKLSFLVLGLAFLLQGCGGSTTTLTSEEHSRLSSEMARHLQHILLAARARGVQSLAVIEYCQFHGTRATTGKSKESARTEWGMPQNSVEACEIIKGFVVDGTTTSTVENDVITTEGTLNIGGRRTEGEYFKRGECEVQLRFQYLGSMSGTICGRNVNSAS